MAHFAQLDQDNVVINVISVDNEDIQDKNGNESEELGIQFCKALFEEETNWIQTSYNASFRKRYAGIGDIYRSDLDAFIRPQPFTSWSLNSDSYIWEPPIPAPILSDAELEEGKYSAWEEDLYQSDNTKGWVIRIFNDNIEQNS